MHSTALAFSLIAASFARAAVQDESPDATLAQESGSLGGAEPLAGLARLVSGEWRVGFMNGESQLDTWHWGPGRHSLRALTEGSDGEGESTSGLCRVLYWHPGRREIVLLGLFSKSRLAEGTVQIDGATADFDCGFYELGLPGVRRELNMRWAFDGPDRYRSTLTESTGGAAPVFLAEWEYVRAGTPVEMRGRFAAVTPGPSTHLQALGRLVGRTWEAKVGWAHGEASAIRSTFEWVPFADALYARVVGQAEGGEPTHLFDAYVYHHPGTGTLHCLALSSRGGVYEGVLTVLEGGALQLDLKGYEGDVVVPYGARFDFEKDGTLRDRIWALAGSDRELKLDVRHVGVEPKDG